MEKLSAQHAAQIPWVEKYRPVKVSEVVGQDEIRKRLHSYVQSRNLPNLLFTGPAGTGKTSSAVSIAKELFGEGFGQNFLELNASDDRGIDVVRNTIKSFARTLAFNSEFKIIFLDESDALTSDAQQALRRTMEKYTQTCRFILSCVTPDTKIVLPEEVELTVEQFMEKFRERKQSIVLTKAERQMGMVSDQVICCIQQNPEEQGKKVFELGTNSGRKIKATNDHQILTSTGWRRVDELNIGDKLIIFPYLEGTAPEENSNVLIDLTAFRGFLLQKERNRGYGCIDEVKKFEELNSLEKQKIIARLRDLFKIAESGQGLTKREQQMLEIVKARKRISIDLAGKSIGLSHSRTAQLLQSLEKKCAVRRTAGKGREIGFEPTNREPMQLRNKMDIKNILEEEFGLKISYTSVKRHLEETMMTQGSFEVVLEKLNKMGLLQLTYRSKTIGAFTRIFAFLYGDGHISKDGTRLHFSGNKETLEEVKKDILELGFGASKIQTKQLTNTIRGRTFAGKTTSFYSDSRAFVNLLTFLGAPAGDKVVMPYKVPDWVMMGTRFVKREFLRSLYGCEGYSPRIKNKNFEAITLRMHKSREMKQNMLEFFEQLKKLLGEFGVKSYIKIRKLGTKRRDGHVTDSYELLLESSNHNLFSFFSQIGYAYEKEKMQKARLASEYLRFKQYFLQQQKQTALSILEAQGKGLSKRAIARRYNCSVDFVINQCRGKEVNLSRSFPSYADWKNEFDAGNGFVFNELTEITEVDCNDVRDITCTKNHNFIANGIIAHNCNYSSKIIEPIMSRCVMFRFKPLAAKDIEQKLKEISGEERLTISDSAINALVYIANGDMRKAINVLQASSAISAKIEESTIYNVSSRARPAEIRELIHLALAGKFMDAREKLDVLLYEYGMSAEDIMLQIYSELIAMPENELPSKSKIDLLDTIGEYNFRVVEGANERIQLEAMIAQFMKYGKSGK